MSSDGASTGSKVLRGASWTFAIKAVERSLGVVSTVILARLLTPSDYGLVAMATALIAVLEIVRSFNFEAALIQRVVTAKGDYDTAWTLNIVMGAVLTLLALLLARPLADFYREPSLVDVATALAFVPLISSAYNIGLAQYRKAMQFRPEFIYFTSRKFTTVIVTIPLAFVTRSYWALVAGILAGQLVATIVSYRLHAFRPSLSLAQCRSLLQFSLWTLIGGGLTTARTRISHFVLGRMSGAEALGSYSMASDLATMPTTELVMPLNRALFPAYAGMANDGRSIRMAYLRVLGAIALVTTAAAVGIFAVGDLLVPLVLGEAWTGVVPLLGPLAAFGLSVSLQTNATAVYWGVGKPRLAAGISAILLLLIVVPLVPFTAKWGAFGTALACMSAGIITVPVTFVLVGRLLGLGAADFIGQLWRPLVAAGVMLLAVRAVKFLLLEANQWMALATSILVGALVYCCVLIVLWWLSRRPDSAERFLVTMLRDRMNRSRRRSKAREEEGER
jgi:lipopolysaccharide exporter